MGSSAELLPGLAFRSFPFQVSLSARREQVRQLADLLLRRVRIGL